jgi:ATP-dependent Lon protease
VLLPARNRKDLEEIPESVRKDVRFVWLERADEAAQHAFGTVEPAPLGATGS